jgi:formylglycine-generating enzyme required for sulfatase activity
MNNITNYITFSILFFFYISCTEQNSVPTITTSTISGITTMSATGGGNVIDDGGAPVNTRGVCWSISPNPTITDDKTIDGSGTGIFISSLEELTPGVTYHVRAYAGNIEGVSYGEDLTFTCTTSMMEMISVSGGNFQMGCTSEQSGCGSDEFPVHTVNLSPFFLGKYEVTQDQWTALMSDITPVGTPKFSSCGGGCPVESVSWFDALVFCNRLSELEGYEPVYYSDATFTQVYGKSGNTWELPNAGGEIFWKTTSKGYRIPTESEWEYAARAGAAAQHIYSGSDSSEEVAWYDSISGNTIHPVGQKQPNALGFYDMSGNVYEWCYDWYQEDYPVGPVTNPIGSGSLSVPDIVIRGGSWYNDVIFTRVASRNAINFVIRNDYIGFRVARS